MQPIKLAIVTIMEDSSEQGEQLSCGAVSMELQPALWWVRKLGHPCGTVPNCDKGMEEACLTLTDNRCQEPQTRQFSSAQMVAKLG